MADKIENFNKSNGVKLKSGFYGFYSAISLTKNVCFLFGPTEIISRLRPVCADKKLRYCFVFSGSSE